MIGIIDYGAGNLKSVKNALENLGIDSRLITGLPEFAGLSGVILPGVGSFGEAMEQLNRRGLAGPIRDYAGSGRPFLGICLGLQLLFDRSEESPEAEGLGIFPGVIRRIPSDGGLKVPHIGWNSLHLCRTGGIFQNTREGDFTYFVHSYYLDAADRSIVAATTRYGVEIDAAVEQGKVSACQFHPEKSGETGLAILRRFASLCGEEV